MSGFMRASSVLLAHEGRVFLVARSPMLRFMGGFVAFPGGKVDADDDALATGGLTGQHVCAARELFEETGVLLGAPAGDWSHLRRDLIEGRLAFPEVLARAGAFLDPSLLAPAGRLVTPPFNPARFDTLFFVAQLPEGQAAEVWPGELSEGRWLAVADALAAWDRGELPLSPPTVSILETVRGLDPGEWGARMASALDEAAEHPPIWFVPGVRMIPTDCQGIPPTRWTNSFLVGTGPRWLVDPGPVDAAQQDVLLAAAGGRVDGIILTHGHPDHIGAALRCRESLGAPLLAHREARLPFAVDRPIEDGEAIDLGDAPHGRGRWSMRAVLTPGHAPGHLAFWQPEYGWLLAADLVSPLSSMVILPEDGDLGLYIESLKKARELPIKLLLPAHGPPTMRTHHLIDETLKHRAMREEQLLAALAAGLRTVPEIARELYRGSPPETMRLAESQVESGLRKLRRENRLPVGSIE
ncbi:MAG: MBL fold metallo-hydrolase [Gemmataceae bacterium]|nr:MBL fold metallo-hydrolase [Gemmataceae bacterium]